MSSEDNGSTERRKTGMKRMWANMSPEERAARAAAMTDGRMKHKAKR